MLPTCQSIFREETYSLLGGPASSCDSSDNRQQEVTVSLSPRATVQIGSQISISEGVIQTQAQLYSYTVSNVPVLVGRDINAVQPVAILTGPSSIPACGQANVTAVDSLYPGCGGFKYSWSIYVEDSYLGVVRPLPKVVNGGDLSARSAKTFFAFIFQLSGWALVAPSCFALHCNCFLLSLSSVTVDVEWSCHDYARFARITSRTRKVYR